ncbi:MAG TPA: hypothetical protein VKH35_17550 [Thermoanaerobaculia bacterium]|jgi:outer membrane murein-binding lipoprotein Lpp|nr:hypothetical protein [Thermoanaerobaculia bacterium]
MKKLVAAAFVALFLLACGGSQGKINDLKTQVDDLNHRIKTLEDDQLKADKQLIDQQQAMQQLHEQMRDLQTLFDKMQYGQSVQH